MNGNMPGWDEWNGLTKEQRDYSLYKVLAELSVHDCRMDKACLARLEACNGRFKTLERRKWFDRGVAAFTGIITGIAAAIGIKL
jgi:hypothetical protein